ncbi:MAG TPA: hypothetical protein VHV99_11875 [Paraburkholderia sp.]|nr:hypothetical protein [Paraburkholderia sp.]
MSLSLLFVARDLAVVKAISQPARFRSPSRVACIRVNDVPKEAPLMEAPLMDARLEAPVGHR